MALCLLFKPDDKPSLSPTSSVAKMWKYDNATFFLVVTEENTSDMNDLSDVLSLIGNVDVWKKNKYLLEKPNRIKIK